MNKMQFFRTDRSQLLIAAVVCVITFFVNNHVLVPDIMESRNIITAREMVYDGNWIIPTMNGELRFEKPPLPTWFAAVAEIASPDDMAAQRFMAGLGALLLMAFFWKFSRHVLRLNPLVPTLLLCTCYNIILMGRTATWDIYCHAFMMAGIYFIATGLIAVRKSEVLRRLMLAGIFVGLSIMSKGPVSLYALFLPFLIAYIWIYRPSVRGKAPALVVMTLLALVIGCWWYVYVHIAAADQLAAVVKKESGSWLNHNVRPWWYYWKFFLETGVWSLLLLTSMFLPLADKSRRKESRWLFSLIWMLGSLVLLSLMPEKKSRYLLPLLIPAAYLMGCMLVWWKKAFAATRAAKSDTVCFRINCWLLAAVVIALPVIAWFFAVVPGFVALWVWIVFSVISLACGWALVSAAVGLKPYLMLGAVTVLFLAAECVGMPAVGKIVNNPDMKSIKAVRTDARLDNVPFYYIDTVPLRIELVYAAGRKIRPVCPDTLRRVLPAALLTHEPLDSAIPPRLLHGMKLTETGVYDDNRRPKGNRRYSEEFIYHVTLIEDSLK